MLVTGQAVAHREHSAPARVLLAGQAAPPQRRLAGGAGRGGQNGVGAGRHCRFGVFQVTRRSDAGARQVRLVFPAEPPTGPVTAPSPV